MSEREYYKRISNIRDKEGFGLYPPLPINNLRIELSNYCNHACIFCAHRKMTRPKRNIDEAFLYRILEEGYEAGFRGLGYYASGEPFMTKKLAEYVKAAKQIGYEYVYIDSNGAAVEFDGIKKVIDAGLDSIKYSINGTNRENYLLIHGRDDFDKVISNLKKTWEYKCSLERKINLFVSFAVTKYTEDTVDDFIKEYGGFADDIITADVIDMGGYVPEVRKYLQTKKQTDFKEGMTVPCYTLWNTFIVTCEGYVTACCADFQNYFVYADLNRENIAEAWCNETITRLRQNHLDKKIKGTPCETCISGNIIQWKALREEYASLFDNNKMFDMSDAERRINIYLNGETLIDK